MFLRSCARLHIRAYAYVFTPVFAWVRTGFKCPLKINLIVLLNLSFLISIHSNQMTPSSNKNNKFNIHNMLARDEMIYDLWSSKNAESM